MSDAVETESAGSGSTVRYPHQKQNEELLDSNACRGGPMNFDISDRWLRLEAEAAIAVYNSSGELLEFNSENYLEMIGRRRYPSRPNPGVW